MVFILVILKLDSIRWQRNNLFLFLLLRLLFGAGQAHAFDAGGHGAANDAVEPVVVAGPRFHLPFFDAAAAFRRRPRFRADMRRDLPVTLRVTPPERQAAHRPHAGFEALRDESSRRSGGTQSANARRRRARIHGPGIAAN